MALLLTLPPTPLLLAIQEFVAPSHSLATASPPTSSATYAWPRRQGEVTTPCCHAPGAPTVSSCSSCSSYSSCSRCSSCSFSPDSCSCSPAPGSPDTTLGELCVRIIAVEIGVPDPLPGAGRPATTGSCSSTTTSPLTPSCYPYSYPYVYPLLLPLLLPLMQLLPLQQLQYNTPSSPSASRAPPCPRHGGAGSAGKSALILLLLLPGPLLLLASPQLP